jgi:hypothetical protein
MPSPNYLSGEAQADLVFSLRLADSLHQISPPKCERQIHKLLKNSPVLVWLGGND